MKLSNTFKQTLAEAASQLTDDISQLQLPGIYSGMTVYLHKPPLQENQLQEITFAEVGIDRSGSFWLYIDSLLGKT